jgi:hypothetical protein
MDLHHFPLHLPLLYLFIRPFPSTTKGIHAHYMCSLLPQALDSTLTHLNRLNRSLESVIGIGNEFSNVEALWSQFEGVMGKEAPKAGGEDAVAGAAEVEEKESALETPPVARTGLGGSGERR